MNIKINRHKVKLLDTGSDISIVNDQTENRLSTIERYQKSSQRRKSKFQREI